MILTSEVRNLIMSHMLFVKIGFALSFEIFPVPPEDRTSYKGQQEKNKM